MTNPQDWSLVDEEVDGQTLALYRNSLGDEIEVRDTYNNPVQLTSARSDRYEVVYDPALDTEVWALAYQLSRESFGRAEDAFDYAVTVLAGQELDSEMVPDKWERILEEDME